MDMFNLYLGKQIDYKITGEGKHTGTLIDIGPDLLVVFEESKFLYIPLHHVHHLTLRPKPESNLLVPPSVRSDEEEISCHSILSRARGLFCEINLAQHQTMYGYMADIQTDYFIFVSPLSKIMMIPHIHLKWMSPYASEVTPYSLNGGQFDPLKSLNLTVAKTFEEQLKQQEGSIISLNEGLNTNKIGLLQKMENGFLELVAADENKHYYLIQHIINVCIR